jgi:hypothetical protein
MKEEQYIVPFINVETGNIDHVFQASGAGKLERELGEETAKEDEPVTDVDALTIFVTTSSPKCRYIRHGGRLWKVCE